MKLHRALAGCVIVLLTLTPLLHAIELNWERLRFDLSPEDGRWRVVDEVGGETWRSNPDKPRFGSAVIIVDGKKQTVDLDRCKVRQVDSDPPILLASFKPLPGHVGTLNITVRSTGARALRFEYEAEGGLNVESVRLFDDAFEIRAADRGYIVVPVREGLLIPADSGLTFTQQFDTYSYEGCHMTMLGLVKNGAAALVTWEDVYTLPEIKSGKSPDGEQRLTLSMTLRKTARSATVHFLGKGDYVTAATAYRQIARQKGYLVTWDQKLPSYPDRAKLFGAVNFKLWSVLTRQMNEDSTQERRVTVNWTFDEAAQVAEHLKNDLKLDKVHFLMGGWIHRGYDNQHPDILPAAPECGGDAKFAECARRVMALGYIFGLHDNYQDMYRDAPSFDLSYVQKHPDGKPVLGGSWAGGRPYITCSRRAVDLAKRPQNLAAVRKLTNANSYFIDTTYAAGLQECFDPAHPLTRADDMHWKQVLSDYAREVFGIFGSECGREWAIPHADYFEGMTGVSGTYYHNANLLRQVGGVSVPLFEMVYRDTIAMYGKYGYDINSSAEYVLHHISIGRTLNYHSVPAHLYWKDPTEEPLLVRPSVAEVRQVAPRRFAITYRWDVAKPLEKDLLVFVHFTDSSGQIRFQNDHAPRTATSRWQKGTITDGPFEVSVPAGLDGSFDVRVGLMTPQSHARQLLQGRKDRERRCLLGRIEVTGDNVSFVPPEGSDPDGVSLHGGLYVRGQGGWTEGMHPLDRFVKNTYEILSPLNEITSRMRMTGHQFLTADRKVRRSVFGDSAVQVIVNGGDADYALKSRTGGDVILPPFGFLVESADFFAFCATRWNGLTYSTPTLFTLRSQDGRTRIYHGFGDDRINVGGTQLRVQKELTR